MRRAYPIALLLAAIAIAITVLMIENPMRSRVDDVTGKTFSPGFASDDVERVEISQLINGAELRRDGERWQVSEIVTPIKDELLTKEGRESPRKRWFRADRSRVTGALGSFGGLPAGVVVSTNRDKQRIYGVEATGLRVKLIGKGGETIEDIIIGRNGPDLASNYVRRPDSDEVYLVSRPLTGAFSPNPLDWRERKLWMLKASDIKAISIESKENALELKRGDEEFEIAASLANVSADGFPRDPDMEPGAQIITLVVEYEGGEPLTLRIYESVNDGRYPARLEGVAETYQLTKDFVESLLERVKK
jgi:hypothetical protein